MSPKAAKRWDKRLENGWHLQRARVDEWEVRPYPELEWPEIREFLKATAFTMAGVVGAPTQVEQDLIQLFGSYLTREGSQPEPSSTETADETWTNLRQAPLEGAFLDVLRRLHAYAVIGTWLDDELPDKAQFFVQRVNADIKSLETVLGGMPRANAAALARSSSLDLHTLRDIARARLAVDEGHDDAPAAGLAWLGSVSAKTILNMISKRQLKSGGSGTVENRSARSWLSEREWPRSCWREAIEVISDGLAAPFQDAHRQESPTEATEEPETPQDWVFVPRAADGSLFAPDLRRAHGWTVGPRGGERSFGDYWRALEYLQKNARPCWRRPNEMGAYNMVVCKDWVRIGRAELDLQLRVAETRERRP
jgi:hypothetical protein